MTYGFISGPGPWFALAAITVGLLLVDLKLFAPNRTPTFREGAYWSVGWLVLALLVAPLVWVLSSADDAITYTTIYFVERSLSLDNLFVFLLLFAYFGIPEAYRARLLFWGIAAALVLRGLAILIANQVTHEGESTWFEGVQLLSVYVVLGIVFFFV